MGPCLTRLKRCDDYYQKSGLAPHTETVTTANTVPVADGQKCEMATCLALVAPRANAPQSEYADDKPITGRVANQDSQPGAGCTAADPCPNGLPAGSPKGVDQVAAVCTKDFMKSHKTKFDLDLMQCVQLRARRVSRRPYHEPTTTTPGPTPANWYCVARFNFDIRLNDGNAVKEVLGPYSTIDAAKTELNSVDITKNINGRPRRIEQFVCEIRDEAQYNNELPPGHPAAVFPVKRGKVNMNPETLGNRPTRSGPPYNQYSRWRAGVGGAAPTIADWPTTSQDNTFEIGCHATFPPSGVTPDKLGTNQYPNQALSQCPDRAEMLSYCQHEVNCNPYHPSDLKFLDQAASR